MKKRLLSIICTFFSLVPTVYAQSGSISFDEFSSRLDQMGVNTTSLRRQSKLSRYQLARLLNAVECQDCIIPTQATTSHFNQQFWQSFSALPGKDFRDISYLNAKHNNTEYYYCVAYVGEQNYMRGYPLQTSPLCSGNFCGQRNVNKGEFYQTLVNLLANKVASKYQIPRKEIKTWLSTLSKSSYEYKTFDSDEIKTITSSTTTSSPAKSASELHLYLKYCMFNPAQCGFSSFPSIGKGVWPLAQMNLLIKEGIITNQDTDQIGSYISPELALQMLYQVYALHTQCSFNNDYDCDGVRNHQDSCLYTYNPSQIDRDGDGIGDTCDEDIDGDGEKNPVGLVDETGNINFSLLKSSDLQDKTPLGNTQDKDQYHFLIIDSISSKAPYTVKAHIQSKTAPRKIERDLGDGTTAVGNRISHTYTQGGTFTLRAKITEKSDTTYLVSNQVYLPIPTEIRFLNISSVQIRGNQAVISAERLGDFDSFQRSNSATNQKTTSSLLNTFTPLLSTGARNNITLKAYKNGQLKAVASTDIKRSNNKRINTHIKLPVQNFTLDQKITATLRLTNLTNSNIKGTDWNFGDQAKIGGKNLITQYAFSSIGTKTLIESSSLTNGETLTSIATLSVENPEQHTPNAVNTYYLSLLDKTLGLRVQPVFSPATISQTTIAFTPQEQIKKNLISTGESIYYRLGYHGNLSIKSDFQLFTGSFLHSESKILLSQSTLSGNNLLLDEKKAYEGLKCDLDKDGIPDIYDNDIDGDGKANLLGLISFERPDCKLIPGENVNSSLYQQHFGVCSLDNCPFSSNADQLDLNENGVGDLCERGKCGDGKIDQNETCVSCPDDVGVCTSICGNEKAEAGETCENCPQDLGDQCLPDKKPICGNGRAEAGETCDNCPQDLKEKCIQPDEKPACGNGVIDSGETCKTCPQDVQRCFSLCGNGIVEKRLNEECDNGKLNGPNNACSSKCTLNNKCGNGNIDPGETCITCPQDVKSCDADEDGIPDPIDECPNIPENINGIQDADGCPEPPKPCIGEECTLVKSTCNSCPCQYADFSNTLHKNDTVRAKLRDQPTQSHYNYSPFVGIQSFIK